MNMPVIQTNWMYRMASAHEVDLVLKVLNANRVCYVFDDIEGFVNHWRAIKNGEEVCRGFERENTGWMIVFPPTSKDLFFGAFPHER